MNPPLFCISFAFLTFSVAPAAPPATNDILSGSDSLDGTADFLRLAAASQSEEIHPMDSLGELSLDEESRPLDRIAFTRLRTITEDHELSGRTLSTLAARLQGDGQYRNAWTVVKAMPDYRRLVAAADLALACDLTENDEERQLAKGIMERYVVEHPLALTFREEGELLLRRAQWAARKGRDCQEILERLRSFPTLEYLAQAEARIQLERARAGEPYDFDHLLSAETEGALLSRTTPDFNAAIGRTQLDIAFLEYDRAAEGEVRDGKRGLFGKGMATAAASRVFVGDVLVDTCAALMKRGEADTARELFGRFAPQFGLLPDMVTDKSLVLARLAPLYGKWAEGFNAEGLLEAHDGIARRQHPVNRARLLAAIGAAWFALENEDRAIRVWSEALEQIGRIEGAPARNNALAILALEASPHLREWPSVLGDRFREVTP